MVLLGHRCEQQDPTLSRFSRVSIEATKSRAENKRKKEVSDVSIHRPSAGCVLAALIVAG
jgi:hypothetical protein